MSHVPSWERASTTTTSNGPSWARSESSSWAMWRRSFLTVATTEMNVGEGLLPKFHHDDVLHRAHALEGEHEAAGRVVREQPGLDVFAGGDEDVGDRSGLGVDNEILDESEDLAVVGHHGLSPELGQELAHVVLMRQLPESIFNRCPR